MVKWLKVTFTICYACYVCVPQYIYQTTHPSLSVNIITLFLLALNVDFRRIHLRGSSQHVWLGKNM